ncbi:hypothetical protein L227DRAFT_617052 [Lentinus tigrinus ALCF2SS1-6]|uniref:DUF6533 domain-containing protein n=1 Tax=Lentinus tigrinus ALCF2SS1-6 TaxID=1328759 RepID=A0A5C2RPX9_9APHY|nr:hypothetical protein L227DRAFT_617052 [Lentinus tigrinus ALCF2SS1-6]
MPALVANSTHALRDVNYGIFIPISFVAWDYMLTFDREISLFWVGRRKSAAFLFFVNRYTALLFNFVIFAGFFVSTNQVTPMGTPTAGFSSKCKFARALAGVSYFPFIPWAVFSAMRAYALSQRLLISVLICLLSFVPPAVHFGIFLRGNAGVFIPVSQCSGTACVNFRTTPPLQAADIPPVLTVSRAAMLADFLLILVAHMTFSNILLWNGTLYFIFLLALNTIFDEHDFDNTNMMYRPLLKSNRGSHISYFLLDLQEANQRQMMIGSFRLSSDNPDYDDGPIFFAGERASFGSIIVPAEDSREEVRRKDVGYGMFIPITFVAWDYILTLDREIRLFWAGPRRSKASILFFANRYFNVVFNLVIFMGFFVSPARGGAGYAEYTPNCKFVRAIAGISYFAFVPWAIFSGLRAYALSQRLFLSILICSLSLMPSVVHFSLYLGGNAGAFIPVQECSDILTVSRALSILADLLLVIITVCSLGRRPLQERLAGVKHHSLSSIIMWNGTLYFLILLVLNVVDLSLSLTTIFNKHDPDNASLTVFAAPVTAVLTSRFLLDLQEAERRQMRLSPEDAKRLSPEVHSHEDRSLFSSEEVATFGTIIFASDDDAEEYAGAEERSEGTDRSRGTADDMSLIGHNPSTPPAGQLDEDKVACARRLSST